MVDRKTSIAPEKKKAPTAPDYTAGQPRALTRNAKPAPTVPLPQSGVDATKVPTAGAATPRTLKLVNRVPLESRQKAFNAFRTFSLSRFPANSVPPNYLTGDSAKDPAAVAEMQRKVIENNLATAKDLDTDNAGMVLSFPSGKFDQINAQLGGQLNQDGSGTIDLGMLLDLIRPRMSPAAFYVSADRELKPLTAETQHRAQAQAIVDSIMNRGKAKTPPAGEGKDE
jgi:hypothetical protein